MNAKNIYVGMRYVPKYMGEWDKDTEYEALSIVMGKDGNGYTSKKPVPSGTELSNSEYWALTGSGNAVIENLTKNVNEMKTQVSKNTKSIKSLDNSKWWFDAETYDLKNDGTSDNTAAFNRLRAVNGYIVLPPGVYKITGNIKVNMTLIFCPGAVINYDTPVTDPDINNWIKAEFNGGIIYGNRDIFNGAIVPYNNGTIMSDVEFSWWYSNGSAEQNTGILNLLYSTKETPKTVRIHFTEYEYNILGSSSYATNATESNDITIEDSVHFKCAGSILLPPGKFYNVTFESTNDDGLVGFMNGKSEHEALFSNCKFICAKIGASNTISPIYESCTFNFKNLATNTNTLFSITNDMNLRNANFVLDMLPTPDASDCHLFNYNGNTNKTECVISIENVTVKINSGHVSKGAFLNLSSPQMKTILSLKNINCDGFLFFLNGDVAADKETTLSCDNIKFNNSITSLINTLNANISIRNVTVSHEPTSGYSFIKQDSEKGSIFAENINVLSSSRSFEVIVNSKMANRDLTQNIFINMFSSSSIKATGGFFVNACLEDKSKNVAGVNISISKGFEYEHYNFYPTEKTVIGYTLTGAFSTLKKGVNTAQLELVEVYSDGTYKNLGSLPDGVVGLIGSRSASTLYNNAAGGSVVVGNDETAKQILITYKANDNSLKGMLAQWLVPVNIS